VVAPRDPDWPTSWPQVGYLFLDDPKPLDPALEAWLEAGEPPVYVGFGSMSIADTARVCTEVIAAIRRTGRRGLVGAGWAGLGAKGVPTDWRVVTDAPHARLFPRCAAIVHHGGSGTTASALRAGTPQVLVPHVLDQFYFAHRLRVLGLAPAPLPVARLGAGRLARAIEQSIAEGTEARLEAARRIGASDGAGEAVRFVESFAENHRPDARETAVDRVEVLERAATSDRASAFDRAA